MPPPRTLAFKIGILEKSQIVDLKDGFLDSTSVSADLLFDIPSFRFIEPFEPIAVSIAEESALIVDVAVEFSPNLLEPLTATKTDGSKYSETKTTDAAQKDLFGKASDVPQSASEIKAYSETKTSKRAYRTIQQSIWDLIYPILLPPLNFDFPSFLDLPSDLYPFQRNGVDFLLAHQEALLGDEMGTGKTVMSVVAMRILFQQGKVSKALVVFPLAAMDVWIKHLDDWAPSLSKTLVRGTKEVRSKDWQYPAHVYLATYDTIASDFLNVIRNKKVFECPACGGSLHFEKKIHVDSLDQFPTFQCPLCKATINEVPLQSALVAEDILESFDIVIIDEAQYIKNMTSDRSRAVKLLKPKWRWAVTGTPLENRLDDLVSIFEFIKPHYLRSEGLTPRIAKDLIAPHFIRRKKADVWKELPPKIRQDIWLELEPAQRSEYEEALRLGRGELETLGGKVTKIHIFSLISKLKRICNFGKNEKSGAKGAAILDLIGEIVDNGSKALVFTQYVEEGLRKIKDILSSFGIVTYSGELNDKDRRDSINRFKTRDDINVFISTVKTGGVAITLTEASYVIHFDHWWNPAVMWQAEDRAHRKGQEKTVTVYSFWMKDTIEERIHQTLQTKGLLFEDVIDGLSEDQIDSLITKDEWLEMLGLEPKREKTEQERTEADGLGSIEEILQYLEVVDPVQFEDIVKDVFQSLGFANAKTTKKSYDGGVDIVATRNSIGGREKVVVQCKRYATAIGVEHARELLGVVNDDPAVSRGYLVASGRISAECKSFCERNGKLACIDGGMLARYILQFHVPIKKG